MKPQHYRLFSQLCEGLIREASTVANLLPGDKAANRLIQVLHQNFGLPHNQRYEPQQNISWSYINDTRHGAWVIIKFANGVGAIKALDNKNGYNAIAVLDDSGSAPSGEFTRGGDVINFFKEQGLGRIQQLYMGTQSDELGSKQNKRAAQRAQASKFTRMDADQLMMKFRPLWAKAIQAAAADIKGMAVTMVQNDSFNKARAKLERAGELNTLLDFIESGNIDRADNYTRKNQLDYLKKIVHSAMVLAAAHFYPEETGQVSRSYSGYSSENWQGLHQLQKDLANGDQKKLGTVLAFFKRMLISG